VVGDFERVPRLGVLATPVTAYMENLYSEVPVRGRKTGSLAVLGVLKGIAL
jgi:hypothetical protein